MDKPAKDLMAYIARRIEKYESYGPIMGCSLTFQPLSGGAPQTFVWDGEKFVSTQEDKN